MPILETFMERLLSVKAVCVALDMHRATVYRKVKAGELDPPLKDGRRTKWPESSIVKYQQSLKHVA
ncbi:MAG TPA: hypothetical protein DEO73_17555 [Pantoea sp.]|nr:hypothetical protein [Pantoea sp.]